MSAEERPQIVGGEALRNTMGLGEFSCHHRFSWDATESGTLKRVLRDRFPGELVDQFIGAAADCISDYAFTAPADFKPKGRRGKDTIAQDLKDLQKAWGMVTGAAALVEGLGDRAAVTLYMCAPWGRPLAALKLTADAMDKAEKNLDKAKGSTRKDPAHKVLEWDFRERITERLALAFAGVFGVPPGIYLGGAFDQILDIAFSTVGLPQIEDKKALIKKSRP